MLRFLPDSWLEALLRPWVLADPSGGIYIEFIAPDWRFAILLLLLPAVLLARRPGMGMRPGQRRGLWALLLMFVLWTLSTGNGRYFLAGLLLIGPLIMMLCRHLPGSERFRMSAALLALGVQLAVIFIAARPGSWALAEWRGRMPAIEDSELRRRPATFLTVTGLSFGSLVPWFHPNSRWANVAGQHNLTADKPEAKRFLRLLAEGPLPRYVVIPAPSASPGQPPPSFKRTANESLALQGLELEDESCVKLHSRLVPSPATDVAPHIDGRGFWFCLLRANQKRAQAALQAQRELNGTYAKVFSALEQRCPRFFKPGDGRMMRIEGLVMRSYTGSDTRILVSVDQRVYVKYFRALNPTFIATVPEVEQGHFDLDCTKIDGRYRLPWQRRDGGV